MRNFTQSELMPCAYITKQRQRVKQSNDIVYLENDDEFEIELFNPTTKKFLAEIKLNNNSIGRGIVLRPGERIFLERFTDDFARKFSFKTYMVEGGSAEVKRAIANNGDLEVKFFKEILRPKIKQPTLFTNRVRYDSNLGFDSTTYSAGINEPIGMASCSFTANMKDFSVIDYAQQETHRGILGKELNSRSFSINTAGPAGKNETKSIETGRVEKGSTSNQKFEIDTDSEFSMLSNNIVIWKILPKSQAPVRNEDIVIYCSKCGMKRKKRSDNFCSKCGTKY